VANWRGGGITRDKHDKLFSELVRMRSDWICEYCKRDFKHDHHGLHCSHLFGRAKQGVRLHPLNAFAHCAGCHDRLGQHPVDFAEWAKSRMGEQKYNALRLLSSKPTKFSAWEKELDHKHFLAEKKRLTVLRKQGVTGRIEFTILGGT
jgi:hypothetical protein